MSRERKPEHIQGRDETRYEQEHRQQEADHVAALNGLKQAYVDAHEHDSSREFWKSVREYLTIALLLITVVLTAFSYIVFHRTMDDAREAATRAHDDNVAALGKADAANKQALTFFQEARQPILWETDDPKFAKFDLPRWQQVPVPGAQGHHGYIYWNHHWKNYGTGTAHNIRSVYTFYIRGTQCGIPVGQTDAPPQPPNASGFETYVCKNSFVTKPEFEKMLKQDSAISFKGKLIYSDDFGHDYETDLCEEWLSGGAAALCPGNQIKKSQ